MTVRQRVKPGEHPNDGRRPKGSGIHSGRAGVFLDRDGTLLEEAGYISHIDRAKLFPWTAEALRKLNSAGLPVVVVTNQSGVGRGYFSEDLVTKVHRKIQQELAEQGAYIDAFYYCPHHPTAAIKAYRKECRCRKPGVGMLEEAAQRFEINPRASYVVGDSYRDMQLGFNAGARTILLMTGDGRGEYEHHRREWPSMPDLISENLLDAVELILQELVGSKDTRASSLLC
jgi:D-glycero-D-manno-heptose 1,7-bisphosphate phosphatase